MDLNHVWHGDRYRSIRISVHDPKVKVTDFLIFMLKFCVKVFTISFCKAYDGFDLCMAW